MLRTTASRCFRLHSRALHTPSVTRSRSRSAIFATAAATAVAVWCISNDVVHNDAASTSPSQVSAEENVQRGPSINSTGVDENGSIQAVVWGSNK